MIRLSAGFIFAIVLFWGSHFGWLYGSLILLIYGMAFRQPAITVLATLLLLTAGISWLWSRLSLESVTYSRSLSATRVFRDETITLRLELVNRKLLPLAYLSRELGVEQTQHEDGSVMIVVLQAGDKTFGLIVDAIGDTAQQLSASGQGHTPPFARQGLARGRQPGIRRHGPAV